MGPAEGFGAIAIASMQRRARTSETLWVRDAPTSPLESTCTPLGRSPLAAVEVVREVRSESAQYWTCHLAEAEARHTFSSGSTIGYGTSPRSRSSTFGTAEQIMAMPVLSSTAMPVASGVGSTDDDRNGVRIRVAYKYRNPFDVETSASMCSSSRDEFYGSNCDGCDNGAGSGDDNCTATASVAIPGCEGCADDSSSNAHTSRHCRDSTCEGAVAFGERQSIVLEDDAMMHHPDDDPDDSGAVFDFDDLNLDR